METAETVLQFWFVETDRKFWFNKDQNFDLLIATRFAAVHNAATQGELFLWRESATGRLAEIIVLDQFSRNIYRNAPAAFANDAMALVLAQEMVRLGLDNELTDVQKAFCYMPYMHSESRLIQSQSVELYREANLTNNLEFAKRHRDIVEKFGRFPHRNAILGRQSCEQEQAFLLTPGSSF